MSRTVYIRFRNRHYIRQKETILLGHIAQMVVPDEYETEMKELVIHRASPEDMHLIVIDMMKVIEKVNEAFPELEIKNIGQSEIIIEIITKEMRKQPHFIGVLFVWLLLFIGSGLAIMNFHHDVSMQEVHQRIYFLVTGVHNKYPLLLQIPYSFGIGLGMVLFFNHLFKKKINEEPSPLEVEMFLYQRNLDEYVVQNENQNQKTTTSQQDRKRNNR